MDVGPLWVCGMDVGLGLCWDVGECGPRFLWGCGTDVSLCLCGGLGWI